MNKEELKVFLANQFSELVFDETQKILFVQVDVLQFKTLMQELRSNADLNFDFLTCLTCVDWKEHFTMVYYLLSRNFKHELQLKVKLPERDNAVIETVSDIWKTAEFHEREVYDLFGVKFENHPDLRRLFLDENWPGYPLRKDYTDENMIEL
jgi:NADH:ubiquinone oxidoreductase subunit C